jgi:hypothetical protein
MLLIIRQAEEIIHGIDFLLKLTINPASQASLSELIHLPTRH